VRLAEWIRIAIIVATGVAYAVLMQNPRYRRWRAENITRSWDSMTAQQLLAYNRVGRWFAFSGLCLIPSLLIVLPASFLLGPGWSDIAWLFLAGVLPLVPAAIFFAIGVFLSIFYVTNHRRGLLIVLIAATLGAIVFSDHLLFVFLLYGILAAIWLLLQKRRAGLQR
jgi:hypothetical protein